MIRYSQVLKKPIIVILLMQFVSFEVYCRGLTEEEEIAKIIEKRKEWLIKNAIATSAIDFEYTGSSDHNRRGLKSGSYYYYLGNTEYRGEVLVNDKTCFINGTTPCAGSIGDSDYIVPLIHFDGHYSSPDGTASKQVSTYMSPSEVIGSSGPVIEREQSFAVKIDPLSWFLVFDCSSVNEQINCEAARREGEQRRGNYFYIQSDEIGRIIHVDEFWGNQLIERQRFFYDNSASFMDQFSLEYREASGHYSLLYVSDPLGNMGRRVLFGY